MAVEVGNIHDVTASSELWRITPSEIVQYNISIPQLLTNTQTLQGLLTQQSFLSILNLTYVNYLLNIYTIM